MTDEPLRFRPEFPILERSTYLISNDRASGGGTFAAIDEIRSTGAWRRWAGRPSLVT